MSADPKLLALAEACGAKITGKPDGSEAITVVFTIDAWRKFDAALAAPEGPAPEPDCWAILTPNGSMLVSPDEAKGRKGAYPLYRAPEAPPPVEARQPSDDLRIVTLALHLAYDLLNKVVEQNGTLGKHLINDIKKVLPARYSAGFAGKARE